MLCSIPVVGEISVYQGDALDVQFTVTWETGNPVDLTNFEARFRVLNTPLLKDSVNVGDITKVAPLTQGILIVHLLTPDTIGLTKGYEYIYKAELYDIQGNVYTFKETTFKVL
jgi:hypothetical protein